jgi:hypothetical protein
MRVLSKGFLITLAISLLASISVFAGEKSKSDTVTFPSDVMVNGTLVKAGEYQVKFDEKTGELSILKGGKLKAKAPAKLESRSDKAKNTAIRTIEQGNGTVLTGVTFGGWSEDVVVSSAGSSSGN